ncbi:MAG TPA: TonB-dependent receptor [Caulobacteraceae bacterium]|jgi:iron complex outermembrane receptor protein
MKSYLLAAASVTALLTWGQTARAADAATAETGSTTLESIIVTAEKRSENIQKVPITVSVVSGAQIDQQLLVSNDDLVNAVPSLTVTNNGVFQVRDVGTQGFGRSAEQSVSVVLDGVVLERALANALPNELYDVDHIEVLSGPQGTLFGQNSNAGVVNIVTRSPVLGKYEAIAHADVGTHDFVNTYVIANLPIGDTMALRLSYHFDSNGHNVFNTLYNKWDYNTDSGVRARFLWEPNNKLTVNVSADYEWLQSNGINGVPYFAGVGVYTSVPPNSPLIGILAACGVTASPTNNRECQDSVYLPGVKTNGVYNGQRVGGSIQIDYDLWRNLKLTSITALRQSLTGNFNAPPGFAGEFGDALPQNILNGNNVPTWLRTFSQELRISSPASEPFYFTLGGYFDDTTSNDLVDQTGQFGIPLGSLVYRRLLDIRIDHINYAAFGQANYNITSKLQVFAGFRVTHDRLREFSFNSFPDAYPNGPFLYTGNTGFFSAIPIDTCTVGGGNPDIPASCPAGTSLNQPAVLSTTGASFKGGVQYTFSRKLMVFATAARGYKGPFFNDSASFPTIGQELIVKPEYANDFELGGKATLFDRVAVDLTLFTEKIDNFQTTIFVPPQPPATITNFIQGNAPHVISRGVDLEVFGNVTKDLSLNAEILYDDAHFNQGFTVSCLTGPCLAVHQLPYGPTWKGKLSGEYHHSFSDMLVGYLQADFSYSSDFPYVSAPGNLTSPARYLLGAKLGVRFDHDRYGLGVFCRNCLDERYPVYAAYDGFAPYLPPNGPPLATSYFLTVDSYRVVGVSLDAKF